MNDRIRNDLHQIIKCYGKDVIKDVKRCESLMLDYCNYSKTEVKLLVLALKEEVPLEIISNQPFDLVKLTCKLEKKLQNNLAMTDLASKWIVETWMFVLTMDMPESDVSYSANSSLVNNSDSILMSNISVQTDTSANSSEKIFSRHQSFSKTDSDHKQIYFKSGLEINKELLNQGQVNWSVLLFGLAIIIGLALFLRLSVSLDNSNLKSELQISKSDLTSNTKVATSSNEDYLDSSSDAALKTLPLLNTTPAQKSPMEYTNSIGMRLTLVHSGEFKMGNKYSKEFLNKLGLAIPSDYSLDEEQPDHFVTIKNPFYCGTYEVTISQFEEFVNSTGFKTFTEKSGLGGYGVNEDLIFVQDTRFNWKYTGFVNHGFHPVVNVTWYDAVEFCSWLSLKEGRRYRLPTEAEWEYACKAGSDSVFQNGDLPDSLVTIGNIGDLTAKMRFAHWKTVSNHDLYVFSAPIGSFQPNMWGFYDMVGNVSEWVNDNYSSNYYNISPLIDPQGADQDEFRVRRGGGWFSPSRNCRSTFRDKFRPSDCGIAVGFRVVLETP